MLPAHSSAATGVAVSRRICSVKSTLPRSGGHADQSSATAPATWGDAMLVPCKLAKPPPGHAERTFTPGALMSGLDRPLPSMVTGPRLLKPAIAPN